MGSGAVKVQSRAFYAATEIALLDENEPHWADFRLESRSMQAIPR